MDGVDIVNTTLEEDLVATEGRMTVTPALALVLTVTGFGATVITLAGSSTSIGIALFVSSVMMTVADNSYRFDLLTWAVKLLSNKILQRYSYSKTNLFMSRI